MELKKHAPRWRTAFDVVSTAAMIALAAVIVWQGRARSSGPPAAGRAASRISIPTNPIPVGDSATRGSLSASVAIIEYADFECSFCARFAQNIEPALRAEYVDTGRVLYVFKHFPLSGHPNAPMAAQAAWCAGRQAKFWEMHDRLFSRSGQLVGFSPEAMATELGLDVGSYNTCRTGTEADQAVRADRAEGESLGVSATPLFFFGRLGPGGRVQVSEVLSGAKSVEAFKAVLDRLF